MEKKPAISPPAPPLLSYESFISNAIGELGRAQILIMCIQRLPSVMLSWAMITISFSAGKTNWWKVSPVHNDTGMYSGVSAWVI